MSSSRPLSPSACLSPPTSTCRTVSEFPALVAQPPPYSVFSFSSPSSSSGCRVAAFEFISWVVETRSNVRVDCTALLVLNSAREAGGPRMRPGPTGPLLNLNISTEFVLTFLQLAAVLLDLATEGEDDDEDADQTVCAICLTFSLSYCFFVLSASARSVTAAPAACSTPLLAKLPLASFGRWSKISSAARWLLDNQHHRHAILSSI